MVGGPQCARRGSHPLRLSSISVMGPDGHRVAGPGAPGGLQSLVSSRVVSGAGPKLPRSAPAAAATSRAAASHPRPAAHSQAACATVTNSPRQAPGQWLNKVHPARRPGQLHSVAWVSIRPNSALGQPPAQGAGPGWQRKGGQQADQGQTARAAAVALQACEMAAAQAPRPRTLRPSAGQEGRPGLGGQRAASRPAKTRAGADAAGAGRCSGAPPNAC